MTWVETPGGVAAVLNKYDREQREAGTVGGRLKRLRLAKGLSQRDLAMPGMSYSYVSRIEAGARVPSLKAVIKLADKLEVSALYLLTGDDMCTCPVCGKEAP